MFDRRKRGQQIWRLFTDRDAELLCANVMRSALGFADATATARSGDGGLDVVSNGAVAQVKFQQAPVGRPAIQNLAGAALTSPGKDRLFFSFSRYTQGAIVYANQVGIALFVVDPQGGYAGVNDLASTVGSSKATKKRARPQPGSLEHQAQVEENLQAAWRILVAICRWLWFQARELSRVVAASCGRSGPRFPPPEVATYRRAAIGFGVLALWALNGADQSLNEPQFIPGAIFGFVFATLSCGYLVYSCKQWIDLSRERRAVKSSR